MSKNQSAAIARPHARSLKNVRTLVVSAVLAAISVVLARLIIPMPDVSTRFSLEAVPIFLAGMFFGPIPGALVGFSADLVGCLFSGYGYNPMFCISPILYGLCPADSLWFERRSFPSDARKEDQSADNRSGIPARDCLRLDSLSELVSRLCLWRRCLRGVLPDEACLAFFAVRHYLCPRRSDRLAAV